MKFFHYSYNNYIYISITVIPIKNRENHVHASNFPLFK